MSSSAAAEILAGVSVPVVETFSERRPAPGLDDHVVCLWMQQVAAHSAAFHHRTVPNGSAELMWTVGGPLRVRGPQTAPVEQTEVPGSITVGMRLRPTAVRAVLGVPAGDLLDLDVEAGDLRTARSARLDEALATAASPQAAATIFEQAVLRDLADAPAIDRIAAEATRRLGSGRSATLASLASELGLSARQLRRRVEAATGVAPKPLHRVLRFQRFLALASTKNRPTSQLARLAAEAGYADQSHLTRESMRLEGRTPGELLRDSEDHCRRAHDHAASYLPLVELG